MSNQLKNNMIKILVDECVAFDIFSIFQVKLGYCEGNIKRQINIEKDRLWNEIVQYLSPKLAVEIYKSDEYKNLYNCNKQIFEILDKAKKEPKTIYMEDVDYTNLNRFKAKQELQKKFFNKESNEVKIGYYK